MSKNPLEEYLAEKTASQLPLPFHAAGSGAAKAFGPAASFARPGFAGSFARTMRNSLSGGSLGEMAAKGLVGAGTAAAGAGAVAGGVALGQWAYDAATKARDFRQVLENNPDLAQRHQEDPRLVNQMFSTLRTFNPGFTKDPVVAGAYLRRMTEPGNEPMAGMVAVEALQHQDKMKTPLGDQVTRAAFQRSEKK